jgi:DNA-binding Lrp family transcriptional regulator
VDDRDRLLLDSLQNDLPLVERPFEALGQRLDMPGDEILERISSVRSEGVVRQISGIFDTRRLGYQSQLVAVRSRPGTTDETARVFNSHPGVTHNYRRDHDFDIWFTIAVPPNSRLGMEATVELMGSLADAESVRPLPALQFFKIGVDLDMRGGRDPGAKKERRAPDAAGLRRARRAGDRGRAGPPDRPPGRARAVRPDRRGVRLPRRRAPRPRASVPRERADAPVRRRAQPPHRGVRAERHGRLARRRRPGRGDGPRHGGLPRRVALLRAPGVRGLALPALLDDARARQGRVRGRAQGHLEETGLRDYAVLYSTREYKKTRLKYFTPELEAWEAAHAELVTT